MEYVCESTENKRILIVTDIHYCDKIWHDATKEERADALCKALQEEYNQNPYDAILCLGDYSLDFWAWDTFGSYLGTPSVSNTRNFVEQVVPRFPRKPYLIPGNHEQYGNEKWKEITGFPRQFSVVYGDYVFLMCDTFGGDLDPTGHSDGTYTGIDPEFLRNALKRHPEKTIVLCMHDLIDEKESDEVRELIVSHPQICCAFAGHIHQSHTRLLGKEWGNLPVIYCGDFSYSLEPYQNWGYQILDLSNGFETKYIRK